MSDDRAETRLPSLGLGSVDEHREGELIAGRYRLERRLASGGMGEVWVATNVLLDQLVAVKLLGSAARSSTGAERLLREARIAARLRHPAIVQVFDVGVTQANEPFLVMELLEGKTAAELVATAGPVHAEHAALLMLPVASALATAHRLGIVHRDLKPENVFLADCGSNQVQPKIIDFGIARVSLPAVAPKLTVAGMLIGTPEFMAPEQIHGVEDVDGRADLWAFGVTLYFLIAGRPPFAGETAGVLFDSILRTHVPFPTDARGLDGELWHLVTECLRRERAQRWQSAEAVETALLRWLVKRGVTEDLAGRRLRSPDARSAVTAREMAAPLTLRAAGQSTAPPPSSHVRRSLSSRDSAPPGPSSEAPSRGAAARPSDPPHDAQARPSLDQAIFSNLKKRLT